MKKEIEKQAERELIVEMQVLGLDAEHYDTNIDGFPDIMAMGRRAVFIEVKFDRNKKGSLIQDIMEPTQPVWMHRAEQVGFQNVFLCVFNGESYNLYETKDILRKSLAGLRISHLPAICSKNTAEGIAAFIYEVCNG